MKQEIGNPKSKIWLLGDSSPKNWKDVLEVPFDPIHPIRHNIWTSIIDIVQDKIFRTNGQRLDCSDFFIRNAIYDPNVKPKGTVVKWNDEVTGEIGKMKNLFSKYKPSVVLSFGAFSFEFSRRAIDESPKRFTHWGSANLGKEFKDRIQKYNPQKTNILPLLHRSIAGGYFIKSHEYFCNEKGANYFNYVGQKLAELFLNKDQTIVKWINPG